MSKPRLHVEAARWSARVELQEAEQRHLVDVLRLRPGAQVEVFDGAGRACPATLAGEAGRWWLETGQGETRALPGPRVHLAVAMLKKPRLDLVIRMATELGVASITPFGCERSVPRPDAARLEARLGRWCTIASQAARQSGQAAVPGIRPPCGLAELLRTAAAPVRLVLHPAGEKATSMEQALSGCGPGERLVLVGPEGGFSAGEIERIQQSGYTMVSLALPVLRAETAAVVAVALARVLPARNRREMKDLI